MKTTDKRIIVGIVIFAGVLAFIAQVFSEYLVPLDALFGDMWMSRVRHSLIDSGVSTDFVCRYVAFMLLHVQDWCLLLVIVFCLGLSSNRFAKVAALSFTAWLPVIDFATGVWSYYLCDWHSVYSESFIRSVMFGFNTRVVPALITLMLGLSAWALGRLLKRLIRTLKSRKAESKDG